MAGAFETCSGTPYLLLRLTGRIVKGCRAVPTLAAGVSDPGADSADERSDLGQGRLVGLQMGHVGDSGQLPDPSSGHPVNRQRAFGLYVVKVVLTHQHQRRD